MSDNLDKNVMDYIKSGEYIQAIKRHREITGLGLKESKEHVDNLRWIEEIKALKSKNIDEMRDKISGVYILNDSQKEFVLDLIDEAFYLGEDSGHTTGYMRSMEENVSARDRSDDMEQIEEDAYNNGYSDGREEGRDEGYESAMEDQNEQSYDEGWKEGQIDGLSEGKEMGYTEGYEEGKLEGYESGHQSGLEQGRSEEQFERGD